MTNGVHSENALGRKLGRGRKLRRDLFLFFYLTRRCIRFCGLSGPLRFERSGATALNDLASGSRQGRSFSVAVLDTLSTPISGCGAYDALPMIRTASALR